MNINDSSCILSPLWPDQNHSGIATHLKGIEWRLFVTLTYPYAVHRLDNQYALGRRKAFFHSFIIGFMRALNLWPKRFAYYMKTEYGLNKQMHLHLLFEAKGLECYSCDQLTCFINHFWCYQFDKDAKSDVIEITPDTQKHWINYITKFENGSSLDYYDFLPLGLRKRLFKLSEGITPKEFAPSLIP